MRILIAACFALMAASCGAPQAEHAQQAAEPAGAISIENAWVAPTPAGVAIGAGYLTITNSQSTDDALIGATSARAGRIEIHEMTMDGDVMRMRAVDRLVIPAGGAVTLGPGGLHLMFHEVAAPFAIGETIEVTLRFEHAGEIAIAMPVRARENAHGQGH